ncbi:MAG: hypothetical protein KTR16_01665 [Acidiferrobacterales bacterium]|nr:hypothetical protein [Acidiferrobacterales bacterium]
MISGVQALRQLDKGLSSVRAEVDRIDNELSRVSEQLHNNRLQQGRALKQMAEIRLDALEGGELIASLDSTDRYALDLFEQRKQALSELEQSIETIKTTLAEKENQREEGRIEVERCAQAVVDCEHEIQGFLEADDAYQAQLKVARSKEVIAVNAEEKATQAEADSQEKGLAYEQSDLFMYLWRCKFGTTEYKANPLARMLDSWVDKLCDYSQYRATYWTLLQIPKRMLTHADQERESADREADKLADIEAAAAQQKNLPQLQQTLEQAEDKLISIDDAIEENEETLNQALLRRADFAKAKDPHTEKSLQALSEALGNQSLLRLSDSAHQTDNPEDNLLVREIGELKDQYEDIKEELDDHRQLHDAKLERLKQLEKVRRQFKLKRYDDVRSGFGNSELISMMLGQFLNGLVNSGELWRAIERHQRHRDVGAWPDFGSGGISQRRSRRSPWHVPGRRRGGIRTSGGFRLPKSGGFSSRGRRGGGFRTGGGF